MATAAAQFCAVDVWSAVCAPVALTILYSESIVTWFAEAPAFPELSCVNPVNPDPTAVNSPALPSRPMAPITSSSACVVAAVAPDDGAPLLPVAEVVRSTAGFAMSPENSFTLIAFAVVVGIVTVIGLPLVSAVVIVDEKTTTRTPEVVAPFARSTSAVYVLPFESAHVTAPADGSIATVTMTVLPTGTPAAGVLTASVVPLVSFELVPTFFTNAGAACAGSAPNRTLALKSARKTRSPPSRQIPSPRRQFVDIGREKGARLVPRKALQFPMRHRMGRVANTHESGTSATLALEHLHGCR